MGTARLGRTDVEFSGGVVHEVHSVLLVVQLLVDLRLQEVAKPLEVQLQEVVKLLEDHQLQARNLRNHLKQLKQQVDQ